MITSRVCNVCKIDQNLDNFHNCKTFPLGKVYTCKVCAKEKAIKWGRDNPEKKKENSLRHYKDNKDDYIERANLCNWQRKNRERVNQNNKKRYWLNRSLYVSRLAEKRARRFQATPDWLSFEQKEQIKSVYNLASELTKQTGVPYQVDHIIPLNNPIVCGLHVPWNLQALPAKENMSKGNRVTCGTL